MKIIKLILEGERDLVKLTYDSIKDLITDTYPKKLFYK